MKTLITLFILLLSQSLFAEDLPSSLFGIKLFNLNNFVLGEEIQKYEEKTKVGNIYYDAFKFINGKVPKKNISFYKYQFFTGKNNQIVHIVASTKFAKPDYKTNLDKYQCSQEKKSLIQSLGSYYSINKFNNIKFKNKRKNGDNVFLIDRDYLEISDTGSQNYNRVLAVECVYFFDQSSFKIRLDSREYYTNLLMNYEVVFFLDFDLLENDLSGL